LNGFTGFSIVVMMTLMYNLTPRSRSICGSPVHVQAGFVVLDFDLPFYNIESIGNRAGT
jgi:hypothetical protein